MLAANALTDAPTIQARLRIAAGTDDALIEQLINEASDSAEDFCGRKFGYINGCIEFPKSMGGPKILLDRTPLATRDTTRYLISRQYIGQIDPVNFQVDRVEIGTLFALQNFSWSALAMQGLNFTLDQEPGTEQPVLTVIYPGGYVTGPQSAAGFATGWPGSTAEVAVDALMRPVSQPLQVWECTTPGATGGSEPSWPTTPLVGQTQQDGAVVWTFTGIIAPGVSQAAAQATLWPGAAEQVAPYASVRPASQRGQVWINLPATTTSANYVTGSAEPTWPSSPTSGLSPTLVTDGSVTWTYLGAAAVVPAARTLPRDLERAIILAVVTWYRSDQERHDLKQESASKASRQYTNTNLPPATVEVLQRYQRAGGYV